MGAKRGAFILLFFAVLLSVFSQSSDFAPDFVASARSYYAAGDYYAAIADYKKAVNQNRFYAEAYAGLADCYVALKDYITALFYAEHARNIDPANVDYLLLNARVLMLLGRTDEASSIIADVKSREPNNPEALLADAELSIAEGNFSYALSQYLDALRVFPSHRGVLVSLAILYDFNGEYELAKRYLDKALEIFPLDLDIYLLAAEYAAKRNDWQRLEEYARNALSIDNNSFDALRFLVISLISQKRYDEAGEYISELMAIRPDTPSVWYLDAVKKVETGESDAAISSFFRLIELEPDDEIARFYLELLASDALPVQDALRKRLADYHFESAAAYKERFFADMAFLQYRYGLRLYPTDRDANLAFALMLRDRGFVNRYADRLNFLISLGYSDQDITDLKELADIALSDDVSARWKTDVFSIEPSSVSVFSAVSRESVLLIHPFSEPALLDAFSFTCQEDDRISLITDADRRYSWEEAFAAARSYATDFFVLLDVYETERFFSVSYKLYHSKSGRLIGSFTIRKSGNDRAFSAISRLSEELISDLPFYATVADRKFDTVLVNAGASKGLKEGSEFFVLAPDKVTTDPATGQYSYKESDILGRVKITALSDVVAEGSLSLSSVFDMVNKGDMLILKPSEDKVSEPVKELSAQSESLLDRIISFITGSGL